MIMDISSAEPTSRVIGTALIWISLWFLADIFFIDSDKNKRYAMCAILFVIGLTLLQ